ncbi:carbohydrate porin [Hoeflea sp. WL0058]|uniref:Carbohydrate porin n=2 Tax=Flavimaribacter sediminis TaxID=2865987 RepID=A0AAE2ZR17_9HYPH|nr:carbohydrate porin [Flavimaribacter sediminis]
MRLIVGAIAACLCSGAVAQDAQPTETDWLEWETATGDWGGARTRLEDQGVTFSLNYTGDLLGNPTGGTSQETAYASGLYGSVVFDFEKLFDIKGLTLYAGASIQQGRDLSVDAIGNIFGVAEAFAGAVARLDQLYFEQSLFHDRLQIAVGRLAAGDDFATADSYDYYVSAAVNGNPTGILENFPSFTTPPYTQWGARVKLATTDNVSVVAGAYNADPSVQDDDMHGVDFRFNPQDGVLYLAQIGVSTNQDSSSSWLRGRYVLGGVYDSSDYAYLSDSTRTKSGNYGFYAIAEQMLYREAGGNGNQGLTAWATVVVAPDQQINTLPFSIYGGAYYTGLFDGRENDVTAVALYVGSFSEDLPGQSAETVLEINHRFQISKSTYITPDFQYVFRPNGGGIPDAAVFGFEASIDF